MTDHDHPVEFLPELALGVLSTVEAGRINEHLASCAACRAEYEEMARVAQLLPLAAEVIEPAPESRERLLERIRLEPESVAAISIPEGAAPLPLTRAPRPTEPTIIRPRRWQWTGAIAASAAAILVGGTALGYALRGGDDGRLKTESARQAQVVEAAGRGDLRVTSTISGTMRASVVRAPGAAEAFIWVEGMPALPAGKRYEAWFTHDGKTFEPSTVFATGEGGVWLPARDAIDSYAAVGLTIEDEGGATVPSGAPFVTVDLTKSVRVR